MCPRMIGEKYNKHRRAIGREENLRCFENEENGFGDACSPASKNLYLASPVMETHRWQ